MAVTITQGNLSTNCKYLSYGGSSSSADAAEHCKQITDTLVTMGWTRYDSAGAGAVLGSDSAATRVLRRPTYDNATTGNYQYLGLSVEYLNTSYYRVRFTHAADWSDPASATAAVNPARLSSGTSGSYMMSDATGCYVDDMLGYGGGGTIWLFNDTHGTMFVFTSASKLNNGRNVFYVGEYNKSYGEQAATAASYLHNGIIFNGAQMCYHSGAPYGATGTQAVWRSTGTAGTSKSTYISDGSPAADGGGGASNTSATQIANHVLQSGPSYPQFALTEYPTSSSSNTGFGRGIESTPEAWNNTYVGGSGSQLATRMHFGWLGWVGHHGPASWNLDSYGGSSVNSHFAHGHDKDHVGNTGWLSRLQGKSLDSYNEGTVIYEPSLSIGHTSRMAGNNYTYTYSYRSSTYSTSQTYRYIKHADLTSSYSGTRIKFSVFGKMRGVKMSIGFPNDYLAFLDSAVIPVDSSGFYDSNGTNTDHWCIPLNAGGTVVAWFKK